MSGLFSKPKIPPPPPPPKVPDPKPMPDPDDKALQAARRRQIASTQGRSGRSSTILSGDDSFGGQKLGG